MRSGLQALVVGLASLAGCLKGPECPAHTKPAGNLSDLQTPLGPAEGYEFLGATPCDDSHTLLTVHGLGTRSFADPRDGTCPDGGASGCGPTEDEFLWRLYAALYELGVRDLLDRSPPPCPDASVTLHLTIAIDDWKVADLAIATAGASLRNESLAETVHIMVVPTMIACPSGS